MKPLLPTDPRSIGGHQVLARLGEGGMGQVFLGTSPGGRAVAIKMIYPALAAGSGFRERFRREVDAARTVSGAFTAPIIDADPEGPAPWLATAYLPGLPLSSLIATYGPLPPPAVRSLAAMLAEALASIHRSGLAHRDLKPANIMVTPEGIRVIDFGIAKAADASTLTRSGQAFGTPGYLAPEQAAGAPTGPPADVFAMGAVLYFAATGRGPFGTGDIPTLLYRTQHQEPDLNAISDPELRRFIAGCMRKDPARRPAPAQLLGALARPENGLGWLPAQLVTAVHQQATIAPPAPRTAPPRPYAAWERRVAAALLDGLFVGAPILIAAVLFFSVVYARENFRSLSTKVPIASIGIILGVVNLAALVTFVVLLVRMLVLEGRTGQSPGKRRLGIELVGVRSGRPVGVGMALVRRLAHVVDSLPCYVGYLWPLWDPAHQTLADKLTHTVVLDVKPPGASTMDL